MSTSIFDPICAIPDCINELFKDSVVRLDPKIEGQSVEKGVMYLGTRSGPASDIDALVHEMCHFTEIDEARMFVDGWGFYHGKWVNFHTPYSPGFYEYFGIKDVEREERVVAWQANTCEYLGIKHDFEGQVRSLRFCPGFDNLSIHLKRVPSDVDKRIKFIRRRILALRKEPRFSGENFIAEWHRRNNILRSQGHA